METATIALEWIRFLSLCSAWPWPLSRGPDHTRPLVSWLALLVAVCMPPGTAGRLGFSLITVSRPPMRLASPLFLPLAKLWMIPSKDKELKLRVEGLP